MFKWFTDLWRGEDRVLMAHGRIVRFIVMGQLFSIVGLIAALVLTVVLAAGKADKALVRADTNTAKVSAVQSSRQAAARDSCSTLASLVFAAFGKHHAEAKDLLAREGLNDCARYAQALTGLNPHR